MPGESQQAPDSAPDPTNMVTEAIARQAQFDRDYIDNKVLYLLEKIAAISSLHDEKFRSVDETLALIERQRVEQKADTKAAVDAALTAQKEAIAKTEASTADQLKQQSVTSATSVNGVQTSLNDVKDRLTRLEATKLGATEQRQETRAVSGAMQGAIGFVLGLILTAITILGIITAANP